jgi:hypothetical protein
MLDNFSFKNIILMIFSFISTKNNKKHYKSDDGHFFIDKMKHIKGMYVFKKFVLFTQLLKINLSDTLKSPLCFLR